MDYYYKETSCFSYHPAGPVKHQANKSQQRALADWEDEGGSVAVRALKHPRKAHKDRAHPVCKGEP